MKSEDYSSFKVHKHSTRPVYLTSNTCWLVPEHRITEPSPSKWLLTVLLMPEFWWVLCRERTWMQAKQPEWNAKQRCEPLHYGWFRERILWLQVRGQPLSSSYSRPAWGETGWMSLNLHAGSRVNKACPNLAKIRSVQRERRLVMTLFVS